MKKILFIPCGIGLGHVTRSWAIIRELKDDFKVKAASYGLGYDFLKNKNVDVEKIEGIEYKGSKNFNLFLTLVENWDLPFRLFQNNANLTRIVKRFDPDIIFTDSDPNGFLVANLNRKKNYVLANLPIITFEKDNFSRAWLEKYENQLGTIEMVNDYMLKYADKIFVPTIKDYETKSGKYFLSNPIVRQEPEDLPIEARIRDKIGIEKDFYLVAFSGSKVGRENLKKVIEVLKEFKNKNFVVLNSPRKREGKEENIHHLPFVDNFLDYLKVSKGIISLAGYSTISEALVYKVPILTFPIKDHIEQMANADLLRRERLGQAFFFKLTKDKIKKKLKSFFAEAEEIKGNLERLNLKGNGSSQIAEFLRS